MKRQRNAQLKHLLREIGGMKYPELEAFFDQLGPHQTQVLYLKASALYDSEKTEPGNLHSPWADDRDLDIGMMKLYDWVH
jgi:hypothetical protein